MGIAAWAVLLPLDALGVQALVLVGEVVAILTGFAGQNNFVARHGAYPSNYIELTADCGLSAAGAGLTAIAGC
jgi:hypothetical protein